ncbi:hypothetical protein ES703_51347 [subsurface metagenome]
MSSKQLTIPGMPPPSPPKPKKLGTQQRIANLESHLFQLELEFTLLRIQLGDKDHV